MWGHNVDDMEDAPDDAVFSQVTQQLQESEQEDAIDYDDEEEPVVEDYAE
jgi:hypothetical protein